jgi:hypothetical protein
MKISVDDVVRCVAIVRYGGEKSLYLYIQKQSASGKAINSGSSVWTVICTKINNKHVFEIPVCEV